MEFLETIKPFTLIAYYIFVSFVVLLIILDNKKPEKAFAFIFLILLFPIAGIVIVLASQGFISLEAGIALAFGANVGTCVTAALAALGKPREAAQAAGVHFVFNVLGVLLWLPLIGTLAGVVAGVDPAEPGAAFYSG